MADKKEEKKNQKEEKVSVEDIKKKREEVLARIDAEIGDEVSDEVVIDEKTDKKIEEEKKEEEKEEFEEKMLDEDEEKESDEEEAVEEKEEEINVEEKAESEKIEEDVKDKEEDARSTFSAAEFGLSDRKSNKGKNILLFAVVFLLVAIVSALFYFFATGSLKFEKPVEEPQVTPTEEPSPTPTPEEFDRAELSVQVLNGSGISGEAGVMQTYLEDLGYEDIEVGNADNSDFVGVTIQIKEEFEDLAELIDEDLADEYTVNEDYEILDEESEFDVVIIVGSEEDEEAEGDTEDTEESSDE